MRALEVRNSGIFMTRPDTHFPSGPATIAAAVAIIGFVSLLLVDHGPWNKASAGNATMIEIGRTAGAAAAVGAVITDTTRSPTPALSGPTPKQPATTD
jgi:hypothetical protein